jgi:microsomal dipeptidase-like Zn-dependent dipeptidase
MQNDDLFSQALELHDRFFAADAHSHMLFNAMYYGKDLRKRHKPPFSWNPLANHIDLPRLMEGGLWIQFTTLYGVFNPLSPLNTSGSVRWMHRAFRKLIAEASDIVAQARTAEEALSIVRSGKRALILALESGRGVGGDLKNIEEFAAWGVRYLTLAHFFPNRSITSGFWPFSAAKGLTGFGKEVIAEMNRHGMLLDVAHAPEKCISELIEASEFPPLCSHTAFKKFKDCSRNISDETMREIAGAGGVIGIILYPSYHEHFLARGNLDTILDAYCHAAELVGTEHLCLGTDMDGYIYLPPQIPDIAALPRLTAGLLARGFSEEDLQKILSGNLLRLLGLADRRLKAGSADPCVDTRDGAG